MYQVLPSPSPRSGGGVTPMNSFDFTSPAAAAGPSAFTIHRTSSLISATPSFTAITTTTTATGINDLDAKQRSMLPNVEDSMMNAAAPSSSDEAASTLLLSTRPYSPLNRDPDSLTSSSIRYPNYLSPRPVLWSNSATALAAERAAQEEEQRKEMRAKRRASMKTVAGGGGNSDGMTTPSDESIPSSLQQHGRTISTTSNISNLSNTSTSTKVYPFTSVSNNPLLEFKEEYSIAALGSQQKRTPSYSSSTSYDSPSLVVGYDDGFGGNVQTILQRQQQQQQQQQLQAQQTATRRYELSLANSPSVSSVPSAFNTDGAASASSSTASPRAVSTGAGSSFLSPTDDSTIGHSSFHSFEPHSPGSLSPYTFSKQQQQQIAPSSQRQQIVSTRRGEIDEKKEDELARKLQEAELKELQAEKERKAWYEARKPPSKKKNAATAAGGGEIIIEQASPPPPTSPKRRKSDASSTTSMTPNPNQGKTFLTGVDIETASTTSSSPPLPSGGGNISLFNFQSYLPSSSLFPFERLPFSVTNNFYITQGNARKWNTREMFAARTKLSLHRDIKQAILAFWCIFERSTPWNVLIESRKVFERQHPECVGKEDDGGGTSNTGNTTANGSKSTPTSYSTSSAASTSNLTRSLRTASQPLQPVLYLNKAQYIQLHMSLSKALYEVWNYEKAAEVAEKEWKEDVKRMEEVMMMAGSGSNISTSTGSSSQGGLSSRTSRRRDNTSMQKSQSNASLLTNSTSLKSLTSSASTKNTLLGKSVSTASLSSSIGMNKNGGIAPSASLLSASASSSALPPSTVAAANTSSSTSSSPQPASTTSSSPDIVHHLSRVGFHHSLFQLCDIWTSSIEASEYVSFLTLLLTRITKPNLDWIDTSTKKGQARMRRAVEKCHAGNLANAGTSNALTGGPNTNPLYYSTPLLFRTLSEVTRYSRPIQLPESAYPKILMIQRWWRYWSVRRKNYMACKIQQSWRKWLPYIKRRRVRRDRAIVKVQQFVKRRQARRRLREEWLRERSVSRIGGSGGGSESREKMLMSPDIDVTVIEEDGSDAEDELSHGIDHDGEEEVNVFTESEDDEDVGQQRQQPQETNNQLNPNNLAAAPSAANVSHPHSSQSNTRPVTSSLTTLGSGGTPPYFSSISIAGSGGVRMGVNHKNDAGMESASSAVTAASSPHSTAAVSSPSPTNPTGGAAASLTIDTSNVTAGTTIAATALSSTTDSAQPVASTQPSVPVEDDSPTAKRERRRERWKRAAQIREQKKQEEEKGWNTQRNQNLMQKVVQAAMSMNKEQGEKMEKKVEGGEEAKQDLIAEKSTEQKTERPNSVTFKQESSSTTTDKPPLPVVQVDIEEVDVDIDIIEIERRDDPDKDEEQLLIQSLRSEQHSASSSSSSHPSSSDGGESEHEEERSLDSDASVNEAFSPSAPPESISTNKPRSPELSAIAASSGIERVYTEKAVTPQQQQLVKNATTHSKKKPRKEMKNNNNGKTDEAKSTKPSKKEQEKDSKAKKRATLVTSPTHNPRILRRMASTIKSSEVARGKSPAIQPSRHQPAVTTPKLAHAVSEAVLVTHVQHTSPVIPIDKSSTEKKEGKLMQDEANVVELEVSTEEQQAKKSEAATNGTVQEDDDAQKLSENIAVEYVSTSSLLKPSTLIQNDSDPSVTSATLSSQEYHQQVQQLMSKRKRANRRDTTTRSKRSTMNQSSSGEQVSVSPKSTSRSSRGSVSPARSTRSDISASSPLQQQHQQVEKKDGLESQSTSATPSPSSRSRRASGKVMTGLTILKQPDGALSKSSSVSDLTTSAMTIASITTASRRTSMTKVDTLEAVVLKSVHVMTVPTVLNVPSSELPAAPVPAPAESLVTSVSHTISSSSSLQVVAVTPSVAKPQPLPALPAVSSLAPVTAVLVPLKPIARLDINQALDAFLPVKSMKRGDGSGAANAVAIKKHMMLEQQHEANQHMKQAHHPLENLLQVKPANTAIAIVGSSSSEVAEVPIVPTIVSRIATSVSLSARVPSKPRQVVSPRTSMRAARKVKPVAAPAVVISFLLPPTAVEITTTSLPSPPITGAVSLEEAIPGAVDPAQTLDPEPTPTTATNDVLTEQAASTQVVTQEEITAVIPKLTILTNADEEIRLGGQIEPDIESNEIIPIQVESVPVSTSTSTSTSELPPLLFAKFHAPQPLSHSQTARLPISRSTLQTEASSTARKSPRMMHRKQKSHDELASPRHHAPVYQLELPSPRGEKQQVIQYRSVGQLGAYARKGGTANLLGEDGETEGPETEEQTASQYLRSVLGQLQAISSDASISPTSPIGATKFPSILSPRHNKVAADLLDIASSPPLIPLPMDLKDQMLMKRALVAASIQSKRDDRRDEKEENEPNVNGVTPSSSSRTRSKGSASRSSRLSSFLTSTSSITPPVSSPLHQAYTVDLDDTSADMVSKVSIEKLLLPSVHQGRLRKGAINTHANGARGQQARMQASAATSMSVTNSAILASSSKSIAATPRNQSQHVE